MLNTVKREFGKSGYLAQAKPNMSSYWIELWTVSKHIALILSEAEYDQLIDDLDRVRDVRRIRSDQD